jgi:hypothetical protein
MDTERTPLGSDAENVTVTVPPRATDCGDTERFDTEGPVPSLGMVVVVVVLVVVVVAAG